MPKRVWKRNLTEQEEWKPWDPGNEKGAWAWASDNAYDEWKATSDRRIGDLVKDLLEAALTKRERAQLPEDAVERLVEDLRENTHLNNEGLFQAILDPMQWAWELAYWPEDLDIQKSVDKAREDFSDEIRLSEYWEPLIQMPPTGPKEWTPRGIFTEKRLFGELGKRVSYERKPRNYDRFLVFDWLDSPILHAAKRTILAMPDPPHPDQIDEEVEAWADDFTRYMFKHLEKRMEDIDINTRYDFDPQWKGILKDRSRLKGVRRDVLKFFDLWKGGKD